jgi:predicted nucleotidyltransferase
MNKKQCEICDKETFDKLCCLFVSYKIIKAVVFGSFARNDQSRHSDIDLMLIQDTSTRFFDRYNGLYAQISKLLYNNPVDLLIYTASEIKQLSARKFVKNILKEGVIIYEQQAATS